MTPEQLESRWQASEDVAVVDDGERVYLVSLSAVGDLSVPIALEGVAADIWRALQTSETLSGALVELRRSYDVPIERLRGDVVHFIQQLVERGLILPS